LADSCGTIDIIGCLRRIRQLALLAHLRRWYVDARVSFVRSLAGCAIVGAILGLGGGRAEAQDDYAPTSTAWNGLSEVAALAQALGIEIVEVRSLDLSTIGPATPLLVVYPGRDLPSGDMFRFLKAGGRLAIADDFGAGSGILERLGVERSTDRVDSPPFAWNDNANLPIAVPRQSHPLNAGTDQLTTNHPATMRSPLPPVFDFGDAQRSVVVAGAVGDGRVVLVSDPSVLINNMLQFAGNRRFAENLLRYLAAAPGSRVVLLRGDFELTGSVQGTNEGSADRGAEEFFTAFNAFLGGLGAPSLGEGAFRALGTIGIAAALLVLLFVIPLRGRLYDGRWLHPAVRSARAGFVGKVQVFRGGGVNYLVPALVYRRELEASLVKSLGLRPPAPIGDVEAAMRKRGAAAAEALELRRLVEYLDGLAMRDARGQAPHVAEGRMADLFQRGERLLAIARKLPAGGAA
jgi:hypothetical protein